MWQCLCLHASCLNDSYSSHASSRHSLLSFLLSVCLPPFLSCYYNSISLLPLSSQQAGRLIILQGQLVISGILTSLQIAPSPSPLHLYLLPFHTLLLFNHHLLLCSSLLSPPFHITAEISFQINTGDGVATLSSSLDV